MIAEMDFAKADKIYSVEAYEAFLAEHTSGSYADMAKKMIEQFDYNEVLKIKTDEACDKFIKKYPKSPHSVHLHGEIRHLIARERTERLFKIALMMARVPVAKSVNGVIEIKKGALRLDFPQYYEERMNEFEQLLKDGANPNYYCIEGFVPYKLLPSRTGYFEGKCGNFTYCAMPNTITLLEYCKMNQMQRAIDLLKKYGVKK